MNTATEKKQLRAMLYDARRQLTAEQRATANAALIRHSLTLLAELNATKVAAYLPVATEPGGKELVPALHDAGVEVLLPLCAPQRQLRWAPYAGPDHLAPAQFGLLEPTTQPGGPDALASCSLILVPALAATPAGFRLGKGGGFYDIALSALTTPVPTAVILYDHEVRSDIPLEAHDQACDYLITPSCIRRH
ncbi:5-formyltetrahydrofolate cyclo-ligase [Staphylococcus chromogenes]|nr:5-formyltetrahydrofolate cyclo-ligase [Staphylococcus chromogenes]